MKLFNWNKKHLMPILIIALLTGLVWTVTGCEEFGQFPAPSPPEEEPEKAAPPTVISTDDRAILTVYNHLLSQAESYKAKVYLADFYATCDKWSAKSELFKDGSSVWHVVIDMTEVEVWKERPHWQQASWFIFQDGEVIPSNRFQANALRIEADLQELSPPSD